MSIYIDIEIKTVFDLSMLITQKFLQNLDCEVFLRMLESKSPARDREFKVLSLLLIHHFLNLLYFYLFLVSSCRATLIHSFVGRILDFHSKRYHFFRGKTLTSHTVLACTEHVCLQFIKQNFYNSFGDNKQFLNSFSL